MSFTQNLIFVVLVAVCIYNRCLYLNQKNISELYSLRAEDMKKLYTDLFNLHESHIYNTVGAFRECAEVIKYYKTIDKREESKNAEDESA